MTMPPFAPPPSRGRVLLVEESSVLRELQVLLLRTAGYHVFLAERPAEALYLAQSTKPDVVVINSDDAQLKEAAFFSQLRSHDADLSITIMSGLLTSDSVRDLKRAGATAVLDRTLNPGLFVEKVDGVLGRALLPGDAKLTDVDPARTLPELPLDRARPLAAPFPAHA